MNQLDTVYRERANGRWEYWTYSEGRRVYITEARANNWVRAKTAKIVEVR